jgi:hypothetical protein
MENIVYKIFDTRMFSDILFVEENPAIVKSTYTCKKDGELVKTEIENIYNLDREAELNDDVIDNIIHIFFVNLNFKSNTKEIKYFKRSIIQRLFKRKNIEDIIKHIVNYDWIIVNDDIVNELEKSPEFEILDSKTEIKLVGKIRNTLIYSNPFDNTSKIYMGNKDSITPVFKNNSNSIEYTYHNNRDLNRLMVF